MKPCRIQKLFWIDTVGYLWNFFFTGHITGEQVGQLAVISRLNVTVFNEAVKKCCYSDEDCKVAFVGVRNVLSFANRTFQPTDRMSRPNRCGRHLGKISGHKSTYVKVWWCTFWWITMFLTEKPWVKLFECQADIFDWLSQALKFWQRPIQSCNRPHNLS